MATNIKIHAHSGSSSDSGSSMQPATVEMHMTNDEVAYIKRLQGIRGALGLEPVAPLDDATHAAVARDRLLLPSIRYVLREPLAEMFGTFILLLFGNGSVAQVVLSQPIESTVGFGSYQSISWGWGLGVMLGVYVAGDSGAYLNPAILFTNCFFRNTPWRRFPIYFIAQFLGGFLAAGVVYANYISAIDFVEGHGIRTVPPSPTATAGIFCTYPQPFVTKASQFFSEFITSAILMFVIYALKDPYNLGSMGMSQGNEFFPLALFFLIFGLGACFGVQTGYAINLARDFGPRLMSYAVGYGSEVFSAGDYYFWIPVVAPFFGCLFGAFLYDAGLYTGADSPLNSKYFGLDRYFPALKEERKMRSLPPSRGSQTQGKRVIVEDETDSEKRENV